MSKSIASPQSRGIALFEVQAYQEHNRQSEQNPVLEEIEDEQEAEGGAEDLEEGDDDVEEPNGKQASLPTQHTLPLNSAMQPLKGYPEGDKGEAGEDQVTPTAAEEDLEEVLHRLWERFLLTDLLLELLSGDAQLGADVLPMRLPLVAEALQMGY